MAFRIPPAAQTPLELFDTLPRSADVPHLSTAFGAALVAVALVLVTSCGGGVQDAAYVDAGVDGRLSEDATAPTDAPPTVPPILSGLQDPIYVLSDGENVFVSDNGRLTRLPTRGGPGVPLGPTDAILHAIDSNSVYFGAPASGVNGLYRVPKPGGTQTEVAPPGPTLGYALHDGVAYWTQLGETNPPNIVVRWVSAAGGAISRAEVLGSTDLGPFRASLIVIAPNAIFLSGTSLRPAPPAALVVPAPLQADAGLNPALVSTGPSSALVVDNGSAYVYRIGDRLSPNSSGTLSRIAADASVVDLAPITQPIAERGVLAIDASHIYWIDGASGVMKLPKAGGTPSVAVADTRAVAIAVDDNALYWASNGSIKRLAK